MGATAGLDEALDSELVGVERPDAVGHLVGDVHALALSPHPAGSPAVHYGAVVLSDEIPGLLPTVPPCSGRAVCSGSRAWVTRPSFRSARSLETAS